MKNHMRLLPLFLCLPLLGFASPTLEEVQNELALAQAKLALAEAKLALAKKEGELSTLAKSAKSEEKPAEQAAIDPKQKPSLTPDEKQKQLTFERDMALYEVQNTEDKISKAKDSNDPEEKKNIPGLQNTLIMQKVALAQKETALNVQDSAIALTKANDADKPKAEQKNKASVITDEAVQALVTDDLDKTLLRKYGFGINLGYGYVSKLKQTTPSLMVRYNFFHRVHANEEATRRMERRTRAKYLSEGKTIPVREKKYFGQTFNDFSGWIGYTPGKFDSLDGTAKESPLLVGLAIGLGHGPDYSSAVSIDVGVALFNNPKFKSTSLYLGVSTDVSVYKAIFKSMADAIN